MVEKPILFPPDEWLRRYQLSRTAEADQAKSRPYLGIHSVIVHVRDQHESLKFYVEKLGFQLVVDAPMDTENRWVAVVPPDGSVMLALLKPWKGSEEISKIGSHTGVALETEDIASKFEEWVRPRESASTKLRLSCPGASWPLSLISTVTSSL